MAMTEPNDGPSAQWIADALESWSHSWLTNADPNDHKWFCYYCQIGTDTKLANVCSGKYMVLKGALKAAQQRIAELEGATCNHERPFCHDTPECGRKDAA